MRAVFALEMTSFTGLLFNVVSWNNKNVEQETNLLLHVETDVEQWFGSNKTPRWPQSPVTSNKDGPSKS